MRGDASRAFPSPAQWLKLPRLPWGDECREVCGRGEKKASSQFFCCRVHFRAGPRDFDGALREHGLSVLRRFSEVQPTVTAPEGRCPSASPFKGSLLGVV